MRSSPQIVVIPIVRFVLLSIAAMLEVLGDSFFQSAIHRSSGVSRIAFLGLGAAVLALYGGVVNLPEWDFGKLLGVYVVFFFLAAQVVAKLRFHQAITLPLIVGGVFIVTGGMIISLWKI
jgi:hypothetical protein